MERPQSFDAIARRKNERNSTLSQDVGNRITRLSIQIDVDDREVECPRPRKV